MNGITPTTSLASRVFRSGASRKLVASLSDDSSMMALITRWAVPTLVGLISGLVFSQDPGGSNIHSRLILYTLCVIMSAILVFLLIGLYLVNISVNFDSMLFKSINVDRGSQLREDITPYWRCIKAAKRAKRSIRVIGPHFSSSMQVKTTSHTSYLTSGIEFAIKQAAETQSGEGFEYQRIVPLDPGGRVKEGGVCSSKIFGDEGLARHVRCALELYTQAIKNNCRLHVSIHTIDFVPSFPSILIIDDEDVFFSLPCDLDPEDNRTEFSYDFVLHISDRSIKIGAQFSELFEQLARIQGNQIKSVID